ncbi:MAG: GNAT family N-acetyltransferase [Pseudomonadota bacterium]|nr:GNAT family N-acetyltransferase [Pseudomonadota bacterium]
MTDTRIVVRTARADYAEAVSALLAATYPVLFSGAYSAEVLALALPLLTRSNPRLLPSGTFHVAENDNGEIVGCGGWSFEHPGSGEVVAGMGHIRHFATHPDWTRRGIGRALLSRCIGQATERGVGILECQSSLVAEAFYRSQGFAPVEEIGVELAPRVMFAGILMRLSIG